MSSSSSTDHQRIVDMLARANQYYCITLHNAGSTIVAGGSRTRRLPRRRDVRFEFDTCGQLIDIKGGA